MPSIRSRTWTVPPWVSSRSYALGTESARTIITNSRRWTNAVLEGPSADVWICLPAGFSIDDLSAPLAGLGICLSDAEVRAEVLAFLASLEEEGHLLRGEARSRQVACRAPAKSDEGEAETPLTSVEADFNDWLAGRGVLPSVFIELTYRCNQHCVHCFNPGAVRRSRGKAARSTGELTTREVCDLLAEMASMGAYSTTFSGGEASLRPDLGEILQEARRLGFAFGVFTNGQLSAELVRSICDTWPRSVGVSLYSADPAIHDATTGVPGSFRHSVDAIRRFSEAGIRTTVKCPLMRHTVHGYKDLLGLCDELGALPQLDFLISPGMDGNLSPTRHQIVDEVTLAAIMSDPRVALHVGPEIPNGGRREMPLDASVCGAGRYTLSVSPDGAVYPCNSLPLPVGNVRLGGLRRIWEESDVLRTWNSVVLSDFNECGLHEYCAYCTPCPGMALAAAGDLLAASQACCTVARVRADLARAPRGGALGSAGRSSMPTEFDSEVRPPATGHRPGEGPPDPRPLLVENFIRRMRRIHVEGNPLRRSQMPEARSPAFENLTRSEQEAGGRFRELGR